MTTATDSTRASYSLEYHDGYPALEDLGLIGDGTTAALVARDGTVVWLCAPRFDSEALFCSLLVARRGGSFRIAPSEVTEARQRYETDSGVLVTELRCPTGLLRITDCLTLRSGADLTEDTPAGRGELLRSIVVLDGSVRVRAEIDPRGGATAELAGHGLRIRAARHPELDLRLLATVPLQGLDTTVELGAGQRVDFVLRWGPGGNTRELHAAASLGATRYLPQESADGLPGHEGAFLLCSFWLVDNLAAQGRLDEAMALYESLCGRAGGLGLLPEEVDPSTGAFLGNYPQAFSHVGVVSSGMNLARQLR